ncbi:alpha/beta fold hydrolase [Vagococcus penaei]|uniref:Alpha/beta hydrolase n=1 Tax=Vagococcus penaei TaxID=633807 RepID=A0A1Q2D5A0_9ENTE|nr:alpha/beta hydrolase [Vagococcus penaei]AQP53387.1 alpha/beta hydrolase [Vagococcus penaei]
MKKKKSKLKKIGYVLLGIVGVLTVFIGGAFVYNQVSLKKEAKLIQPYGKKLSVFDGEINIVDEGQGDQTIILLPGYGTASPYLDFKPLVKQLNQNNRVITIEPFGYGLSSQTKRERTTKNIIEEIHEVVSQLNLSSYVFMGHSIAGLYGVNYVNEYPDEPVKAFVGIDTSTPEQPMEKINLSFFDFLKSSGLMRLVITAAPDNLGKDKNDPDFEQLKMITFKNLNSTSMKNEYSHLFTNFKESKGLRFPSDLPVLLFIVSNDPSITNWKELHEDQISGLKKGQVIELNGDHYLHHTQYKVISEDTDKFLNEIK